MGIFPRLCLGLTVLCLGLLPAHGQPLPPAQQTLIEAPPNERPYQVRLHFLESNEHRHDVFFPHIRDRGGAYLGVGADQNYTLAAVANAELLWLVDIDGHVVQWHRIYSALVPLVESPAQLADLFAHAPLDRIAAALRARYEEPEASVLLRAFVRDRARLSVYLRREVPRRFADGSGTWLSDPVLFQRVRALMQSRRVIARIGDLHGEHTLLAIGAAAQAAQRSFQVVYLSNVEQWFRYSPQFQRNLAALPAAPQAVVLRTLARRELRAPVGDRWHFSVQPLADFISRMASGELKLVQGLIPEMSRSERGRGISVLGPAPVVSLAAPSRP